MNLEVNRGDIFLVNLGSTYEKKTCIQTGIRPSLVVSNEACNKYSPTITIIPISSRLSKTSLPTHVILDQSSGLLKESIALVEQIQTIDKTNLINFLGHCTTDAMQKIEAAIKIQSGLIEVTIDYEYINLLIKKINDKERFIDKYSYIDEIEEIINDKDMYIAELKKYCREHNINYTSLLSRIGGKVRVLERMVV
jgi:mRNA interferase MazF